MGLKGSLAGYPSMNSRNSVLSNIYHILSGNSVALLLGFMTHAYLARILGTENYGILGFAVSVVTYFGILAALGTDIWATRSIARGDQDCSSIAGQIVSVRLALSVFSFGLLTLLLSFWNQPMLVNLVTLVQASTLLITAFTLDFAFQGLIPPKSPQHPPPTSQNPGTDMVQNWILASLAGEMVLQVVAKLD